MRQVDLVSSNTGMNRVHAALRKPGNDLFFKKTLENLEKHLEKKIFLEKYYEFLKA